MQISAHRALQSGNYHYSNYIVHSNDLRIVQSDLAIEVEHLIFQKDALLGVKKVQNDIK